MKPGATVSPAASIRRVAGAVRRSPIVAMRPPRMPTSARHRRCALAVDHRAAGDHEVVGLLRGGGGAGGRGEHERSQKARGFEGHGGSIVGRPGVTVSCISGQHMNRRTLWTTAHPARVGRRRYVQPRTTPASIQPPTSAPVRSVYHGELRAAVTGRTASASAASTCGAAGCRARQPMTRWRRW